MNDQWIWTTYHDLRQSEYSDLFHATLEETLKILQTSQAQREYHRLLPPKNSLIGQRSSEIEWDIK